MAQETKDYLGEKHVCNRLDEACKAKIAHIKADPKTANALFDQEDWEPSVQDLVCKANHDALKACIAESPAKIWARKSLTNALLFLDRKHSNLLSRVVGKTTESMGC